MSRRLAATLAGLSALAACGGGGGTVTGGRKLMAEAVLTPAGGALVIDQGTLRGFRIDVPPGALAAPTLVRVFLPTIDGLPAVIGWQIVIEPESVALHLPVQITVPFFGPLQAPLPALRGVVTTLASGSHVSPVRAVLLDPTRAVFDADRFGVVTVEMDPPTVHLRDYLPEMLVAGGVFEDGLRCLWQQQFGSVIHPSEGFLSISHLGSGTDETLELHWGVEALQLVEASDNAARILDVLEHAIPWAPVLPELGEVSGGSPIAGFTSFGGSDPVYRGAVAHAARLLVADPIETPAGLFTDVVQLQTETVWIRGAEATQGVRRIWLARAYGIVAMQFGDGPMLRLVIPQRSGFGR